MKQLLSPVLGKLLDHLNQGRHKLPHQQNLLNPLLPLLPLHLLVLVQLPAIFASVAFAIDCPMDTHLRDGRFHPYLHDIRPSTKSNSII